MGINAEILIVTPKNKAILNEFISGLDREQDSFRYFKNRDLDVIKNHLITILLLDAGNPIGYGHLDKEDDKVWLGIVIKEDYQGKGLANILMNELLRNGDKMGINTISLSVDTTNERAKALYKKHGFHLLQAKDHYVIYQRNVKE
ncbi:GNAT family N-acetyltransferase [Flagellimonas sp.]|uniref:GNAT family N-acetyltransferase n=1 Tax=Flagellimonas sp. TaxID=2058762 RepID=UPI003BAA8742